MSPSGKRWFLTLQRRLAAETGSVMEGKIAVKVIWPQGEERFTLCFEGTKLTLERGLSPAAFATMTIAPEFLFTVLSEKFHEIDIRFASTVKNLEVHDSKRMRLLFLLGHLCNRPTPLRVAAAAEADRRINTHGVATTIERRPFCQEILDDHLERSRPLVLTKAISDWPSLGWTAESVAREHGDVSVGGIALKRMFGKTKGVPLYVRGARMPPELANEFGELPFFKGNLRTLLLFGGQPGGVNHLHRDFVTGFLVHIFGQKRFLFYPPTAGESVYAMKHFGNNQPCWVDVFSPDLTRHPRLPEVTPIELWIEPGDVLVIPVGWYHAVQADEPTLSLTTFIVRDGEEAPAVGYS